MSTREVAERTLDLLAKSGDPAGELERWGLTVRDEALEEAAREAECATCQKYDSAAARIRALKTPPTP